MTTILGLSAFYHDSAAALIQDGRIIAAAQEERFSRIKHDANYPRNAIDYVLKEAAISLGDVDVVAFYDKPFLKFERLLDTYLAFAPRGLKSFQHAMPLWLREKLFQKDRLLKQLARHDPAFTDPDRLLFAEHHVSHAASAYYPSPFEEAVVLTLDGVGEWATTTVAIGRGKDLEVVREIHFPHSIGLLYSAFTYYLGFRVNSGEYKVMGLAPYGQPVYKQLILDKLIDVKSDGSFRLDMRYFNFATGLTMTNEKFNVLFSRSARQTESEPLTEFHMNVAASIQAVIEDIVLRITRSLAQEYRIPNLCLAGGVALNCVANGKVLRDGAFDNLWVQPAAGDAGGAVGAAFSAYHQETGHARKAARPDGMQGALLGPAFTQQEIEQQLQAAGAEFESLSESTMLERTVQALSEGKTIGWFQGRMEFGPRALGARSIIADPRSAEMQKRINLKVKNRESFRPFAPSVLREDVDEWFDLNVDSPYMQLVAEVNKKHRLELTETEKALTGIDRLNSRRSDIPAVTHVDYSARVQTVSEETNPLYYALLKHFKQITGCPVLLNTSFNIRSEPIVCSPRDAYQCFIGTELDMLVCGNAVLLRENQSAVQ